MDPLSLNDSATVAMPPKTSSIHGSNSASHEDEDAPAMPRDSHGNDSCHASIGGPCILERGSRIPRSEGKEEGREHNQWKDGKEEGKDTVVSEAVVVKEREKGEEKEEDRGEDFFEASMFIDESYELQDFTWGPHRLRLWALHSCSTDYDLTGQIVWPGTELMCDYLSSRGGGGEGEGEPTGSSLLEGKSVLELGSGIGVTGLLCGRLGAKSVLLTDHNDTVLKVLQRNMDKETETFAGTTPSGPAAPFLECAKLEWGLNEDVRAIMDAHPLAFDVIVGADVCYQRDTIPLLFSTVRALMDCQLSNVAPSRDGTAVSMHGSSKPAGGGTCATMCEESSLDRGARPFVFLLGYVSRWASVDRLVLGEAKRQNFSITEVMRRRVSNGTYDGIVYEIVPMLDAVCG